MKSERFPIPRRTFLRGLGTAVALPFLDAMLPSSLVGTVSAAAAAPPRRLAFIYVPNGAHMPSWTPEAAGAKFDLPPILKPLAPFRRELLVVSGLTQDKARANGDGPGDHARAAAAFLTGAQPVKTGGANIRAGMSADQLAAERVGHLTPFRSLEIGCERGRDSGSCDSGYSCAYSNNISWKTESMPMAKETDPRALFRRLFPSIAAAQGERDDLYRKSILDLVLEDAKGLRDDLGATDRRKLDEYLTSVREIEERIARQEKEAKEAERRVSREARAFASELPDDGPGDFGERIRLMNDILALAFQADLTRVATFMIANEGSNRSYKEVGVSDGHHDLSHHGKQAAKQEKIEKINLFHIEQLAHLLQRLKRMRERGRSILDYSMIVYGSGISDGDRHNHHELPILVLGRGGGTLRTGQHIRYPKNTPLNNLFLSLLERMGAPVESLGDSTGRLPDLT